MFSFQVIAADSKFLDDVFQFLGKQGISKTLLKQKLESLKKNPSEQCFGIARNSQGKIIGVAELFVQFKFTRGLSQVCHLDNVWVTKDINNLQLKKQIRIKIEEAVGQYSGKQKCYKMILAESQKNNFQLHEKAGMKLDQVYMETQSIPHITASKL